MTNQQIIEKAINLAIDEGWTMQGFTDEGKMHFTDTGVVVDFLRGGRDAKSANDIIFNHDFAKALWGEEIVILKVAPLPDYPKIAKKGEKGRDLMHRWQYHLQQMVIADDPIKYLGDNI